MRNTFPRTVKLPKNQSFFLFGGRGTGKSFLLKERFSAATTHYIDLLNTTTETLFSKDPGLLYSEIIGLPNSIQVCVIVEIQKVPRLLNEIHRLIENPDVKLQFALTGSNARKLKTGGANLLAGRAVLRSLFPLLPEELGEKFALLDYLTGVSRQKRKSESEVLA